MATGGGVPKDGWRGWVALGACTACSLLAATPNTFGVFGDKVSQSLGWGDTGGTVVASMGVVGLYFTLPAGLILDRVGSPITMFLGAILMSIYIILSLLQPPFALVPFAILFALVGFGSGAAFLAALSMGIHLGPLGVGCAGAGLSLSMSVGVGIMNLVSLSDCDDENCWRITLRAFAAVGCTVVIASAGVLWVLSRAKPTHDHLIEDEEETLVEKKEAHITVREAAKLFSTLRLWCVMLAYFAGVSSGMIVVILGRPLWANFSSDSAAQSWEPSIAVAFSVCTATANVVSPILAAKLPITTSSVLAIFHGCGIVSLVALLVTVLLPRSEGSLVFAAILMASLGAVFGATLSLVPILADENWGRHNFGVVFSLLQAASVTAVAVMPLVTNAIFHAMDSFGLPIGLQALACTFAVIAMIVLGRKQK